MAQDTPIWNHIGTPLTPEQITNIQHVDDEITPESIDIQSQSIMKVAEELAGSAAGGSVIALSQLAAQSEKLNVMEYRNQILDYLDEWDDVVTNLLDDELKIIRKFNKKRTYYVSKVDGLREQVNRIEKRGAKRAPHRLVEKLERNEQKLQLSDQVYQEYSNTVALNLTESIRRGWVDLYPVLESIMEFEVNKLSRDNSILGQLSVILATYRDDFKDAVKGTADEV
jgi:HPt (histidine-containing phosphotransfer) domain-containing protein